MSVKALLHYVLEEVAIDGEEGASNCLVASLVVSCSGGMLACVRYDAF